jgi:hypothetical protein
MTFWSGENYFEFRYFILTYMMELRKVDPDSYNSLMENEAFRLAFTEIDDRFSETVNRLEHIYQAVIPDILNGLGYSTKMEEKPYTWELENGFEMEFKFLYLTVIVPEIKQTVLFSLSQYLIILLKQEMAQPEYMDMVLLLRIDSE